MTKPSRLVCETQRLVILGYRRITKGLAPLVDMMYQAVAPTWSDEKYLSPSQSLKPFIEAAITPRPSAFNPFACAYLMSSR